MYVKVTNVANHQDNANQNHIEMIPHTSSKSYSRQYIANAERMWNKKNLSTLYECKLVQS